MSPTGKLGKAAQVLTKVADIGDLIVDVEREDGDGRVDRITLFGFLDVFDRARGARRRARRRDRKARDTP